jgi:hypothetical protein
MMRRTCFIRGYCAMGKINVPLSNIGDFFCDINKDKFGFKLNV